MHFDPATAATQYTPPGPDSDDRPAAWDMVIAHAQDLQQAAMLYRLRGFTLAEYDALLVAMRARDRMGTEKYGRRLRPHNGQNPLQEALQESLDLCAYLACYEHEHPSQATQQLLGQAIYLSLRIVRQLGSDSARHECYDVAEASG